MSSLLHFPSDATFLVFLLRLTLLLLVVRTGCRLLRHRNPRWQILLLRAGIAGVAILPLFSAFSFGWGPRINSPAFVQEYFPERQTEPSAVADRRSATAKANSPAVATRTTSQQPPPVASGTPSKAVEPVAFDARDAWRQAVLILAVGYFAIVLIRLFQLSLQWWLLRQLLCRAAPADLRFKAAAALVAQRMHLLRVPRTAVSSEVYTPLVAGILAPVVVLPVGMADRLSEEELQFVIGHECSHLVGRDLIWGLLAELVRCVLWPHPLAFGLPEAHRAACDLRCDAVASGRDHVRYRQMLAELALNLNAPRHRLPAMSFATPSDIVRRVERLQNESDATTLNGRRRWGVVVLLGLLAVIGTAGINSSAGDVDLDTADEVSITVVNENGEPVVGADVQVEGLRARKESASGFGNRLHTSGKSNNDGVATVRYPRFVTEEMETGHLILTVTHPDYSLLNIQSYDLDLREEIRLKPGRKVTVTAIDSTTGEPIVEDLHALLPGRARQDVWAKADNGTLNSATIDQDTSCLLLVCLRKGQPTLFSDLIDLADHEGRNVVIRDVPLSPGKRVTGRLSDEVTRSVENGIAGLCISMTKATTPSHDTCIMWRDYAVISADGTFEFASVPRHAEIQLTATCDGWVSKSADPADILERFPYVTTPQYAQIMHDTITVALPFAADSPQPLVVPMNRTATCRFSVVDANDRPVADAYVSLNTNTAYAPGPGGIVGDYFRTASELLPKEEQRAFAEMSNHVMARYHAKTDALGKVTIDFVPPQRSITANVFHPEFVLPAGELGEHHRGTRIEPLSGETLDVKLQVQRKGVEVLGR